MRKPCAKGVQEFSGADYGIFIVLQPASAQSEREHSGPEARAALRLLAVVWGAPGNPFLGSKQAVDQAVHLHFLHFAKLFHGRSIGESTTTLCRLHLEVPPPTFHKCSPGIHQLSGG